MSLRWCCSRAEAMLWHRDIVCKGLTLSTPHSVRWPEQMTMPVLSKGTMDVDLSGVPSKHALCAINAHAKSSTVSELKVL